jgi:DNA-binding transcriptional regulator YhcF (GntR family)
VNIQISLESEIPFRHQLREQILLQIGTGQLAIGHMMPSVRTLAPQLKIHRNTVGDVYANLVRCGWLVKCGTRLFVLRNTNTSFDSSNIANLDDLVRQSIRAAREIGCSAEGLAARVQSHLTSPLPHAQLVVGPELPLAELISEEIRLATRYCFESYCLESVLRSPAKLAGAVVISPNILVSRLERLSPTYRNFISLSYSTVDKQLTEIQNLSHPSVVGVLSMSQAFLKTARGVLAPALGKRHVLREFLMNRPPALTNFALLDSHRELAKAREGFLAKVWDGPCLGCKGPSTAARAEKDAWSHFSSTDLKGIDLLFCDSICFRLVNHGRKIHYQLVSEDSLKQIQAAFRGYSSSGL